MASKKLGWFMAGLLTLGFVSFAQAQDYPVKDITGIIQWGAGGTTDIVSRAITPHVEKILGKSIVLQNRPGATGAIATQFVATAPADGYTLLYGAENPQIYKVLDIAPLDYTSHYTPINILARAVPVIVCNNNEPWKTVKDLFDDAKRRPGVIKMGSTGTGGVPHVVSNIVKVVEGLTFNHIPFEGDGPGIVALLGGHTQFSVATFTAVREHIRAGRLRPLALVSDRPIPGVDIPLITAYNKEYERYLPWGPFFGVHVRKEVPEPVKAKLIDAFQKGASDPKFVATITDLGGIVMNLSGTEADRFLRRWQSVTSWILQEAGAAKVSPEKLGIPKP